MACYLNHSGSYRSVITSRWEIITEENLHEDGFVNLEVFQGAVEV